MRVCVELDHLTHIVREPNQVICECSGEASTAITQILFAHHEPSYLRSASCEAFDVAYYTHSALSVVPLQFHDMRTSLVPSMCCVARASATTPPFVMFPYRQLPWITYTLKSTDDCQRFLGIDVPSHCGLVYGSACHHARRIRSLHGSPRSPIFH